MQMMLLMFLFAATSICVGMKVVWIIFVSDLI
jgi:hypothetical protein